MSGWVSLVLVVSLVGLIAELIYRALTRTGRLGPRMAAVLLAVGVLAFVQPSSVATMGAEDDVAPLVLCYVAMILGMLAENGYAQAERGGTRLTFRPMALVMPILASPIVFIPLLTLTAEMSGGAFTRAKLMVYLVAFQNGFFWKTFLDQRRAQVGSAEPVGTTTHQE